MTTTAWFEKQQDATRAAADRFGVEYTLAELDAIMALHAEGARTTDIALAAGRTYAGVASILTDSRAYDKARTGAERRARQSAPVTTCAACWMVHAGECP
jgi:regulator of protease activity HflC (stomatin/prohibitin superfamily)